MLSRSFHAKSLGKLLAALCLELLLLAAPAVAQIAGPVLPQFGVTPPGVSPRQFCAKTADGKCWPFMTQDPVTGALSLINGGLSYAAANRAGDTITGPYLFSQTLGLPSIVALDLTYAGSAASMANAVKFGPGNMISSCPGASCVGSPAPLDHQRTSALISSTSQTDNQAEEQTLLVETVLNRGAKKPYAINTAYALGDNVIGCNANGYCSAYRATTAGTTGAAAPTWVASRPTTSTAPTVTDGGVTWLWINEAAITTKLGAYIETLMYAGAGFSEGLTTNFLIQPGADPTQGAWGVEHDFSNFTNTDCVPGVASCYGMRLGFSGTAMVQTGISIDGSGGLPNGKQNMFWGIRMGNKLASYADIDVADTGSAVGVFVGNDGYSGAVAHSDSGFKDVSTANSGLHLSGAYSNSILIDSPTQATGAQIAGRGFNIDPVGGLNGYQLNLSPNRGTGQQQFTISYNTGAEQTELQSTHVGSFNTQMVLNPAGGLVKAGASGFAESLTTPASSSAACITGQFTDDANYHYVCVATNTWKRAALSAF